MYLLKNKPCNKCHFASHMLVFLSKYVQVFVLENKTKIQRKKWFFPV